MELQVRWPSTIAKTYIIKAGKQTQNSKIRKLEILIQSGRKMKFGIALVACIIAVATADEHMLHDGDRNMTFGGDKNMTLDGEREGEREGEGHGVHVKILGKSGKMMIGTTTDPSKDPNRVTVNFDSMVERDESGTEIGKGKAGHSFNSFASRSFNFTKPYNTTLGNATVTAIDFLSTLVGGASLRVTTFMITTPGIFKLNKNETLDLRVGSVKFNVEIENWPFCSVNGTDDTLCKNGKEVGAFLDLAIEIKGKGAAKKKGSGHKKFDLGEGVELDLSTSAEIDGVWTTLPDGYPTSTTQGSKQIFVFRFPRFEKKALYDPVIYAGSSSSSTTSAPTSEDDGMNSVGSIFPSLVLSTIVMNILRL